MVLHIHDLGAQVTLLPEPIASIVAALSGLARISKALAQAITIPEKLGATVARVEHSRAVRASVIQIEKLVADHLAALRFEPDGIQGTVQRLCMTPNFDDLYLLEKQVRSSRDALDAMLKTIQDSRYYEARFPKEMKLIREIRYSKLGILTLIGANEAELGRYVKGGKGVPAKTRQELLSAMEKEFSETNKMIDKAQEALARYIRNEDAVLSGWAKQKK